MRALLLILAGCAQATEAVMPGVDVVSITVAGTSAEAVCPDGYRPISGGCTCHLGPGVVWRSAPVMKRNAWACGCTQGDEATAHAVCVEGG